MAIKITGSAQNYRVGRVSGNTHLWHIQAMLQHSQLSPDMGTSPYKSDLKFAQTYMYSKICGNLGAGSFYRDRKTLLGGMESK